MKKSWKEVTLADYYEILDILKDDTTDEMDRNIRLMAVLCDLTPEQAYNLPIREFERKMSALEWVFAKPTPEIAADTYVIKGTKYNALLAPEAMTTAQYIDFKQSVENCEDHLQEMLSIFLIPQGKEYNEGYDIKQVENDILNYMPITQVMGLTAFFLTWSNAWMDILMGYSVKMLRKTIRKEKDPEKKKILQQQLTVMSGLRCLMRSQK